MTDRYTDYATEPAAMRRSIAIAKAAAGDWRPAGDDYPEGDWPGRGVGNGRHGDPKKGIGTHAVPVQIGRGDLEGRFLVRDETGVERTEADVTPAIVAEPERVR